MKLRAQIFVASLACLVVFPVCSAAQENEIPVEAQLSLIHNVKVATADPGIVEEILVKEGDLIALDQLIVRLDHRLNEADLSAAKSEQRIAEKESENEVDLEYAEKSSAVNQKVLERSQNAFTQYAKSISRTEIDQLQLELDRSILSGEQARHSKVINELTLDLRSAQVRLATLRLENREIKAPLGGMVAEVQTQKGEWVGAGQPICRIIDLTKLRAEAFVDKKHVFKFKAGQSATFSIEIGGERKTATGTVVFVSPEVNPISDDFLVRVDIDNSNSELIPGLKGILTIALDK